jgi:tRNA (cmo5U34)-methyltransferase
MSLHIKKSSPEEIRQKFNSLVDRYSDSKTGQNTAVDSVLIADIIARVAASVNSEATDILDIGCGAGNYAVKIASCFQNVNVTLVDLSEKMLEKAAERLIQITNGKIDLVWGDIREIHLTQDHYDIAVAATSLHHLRDETEWAMVFKNVYRSLKPGGSFWISDLIKHDNERIHKIFWDDYGRFLLKRGGIKLKDWVFEQIKIEDSPSSLYFQTELLKKAGFSYVDVLHKNMVFAAFGGIK